MLKTYFAPAEKAKDEDLRWQISCASSNPIINGVMSSVGGLLAVLNEQRQVLAVNDKLLAALEIDDPAAIHGLRPGQFIHCVHADEPPHGCGTTRACASCGAAIATSSMTTEMVVGKTIDEALAITREQVADALGGLPPVKMHCSNLAADALHAAIKEFQCKQKGEAPCGGAE